MFDIKIPNEEIIESQKKRTIDDLTSEFDKKMITKALDEVDDDKKDWVIRPLIFDSETSDPISTPILSQLTFKTIGDSNLEILDKCGKMFEDVDDNYTNSRAYNDLSNGLVDTAKNIKIPPIAMGEVIPYNIANNQDSTQTALNTLADMIQSLQSSMVTEETLDRAIANVIANMPDFYIGQEKLARIVRQGNSMLDRRYGY